MRNNLKVERARHNLTQAALAEKAKVSRQTINAIESGKYIPSTVLALRLSAIFGLPVNALFELEEEDRA
ncbi:helix-turn-helix transcriptional regulator [Phaeodactylibacter luteus]|uniref:Helix-turn-helix transcriptional regulator n=1 Tax=Phaeodactylibacter luteus TaxID=1564516 RepID=A0A5C6RHD0_9BACT|nr:helix-turn-helix transcriptional regulator [Phaeodactylibacter luteus]TXB61796.1 helix-turn-helix transcriptional regulator [Phaeodactylibacter luteus]